ncbi:MAG: hypothetical protein ACSHX6_05230 [Akkermansiaceae bacterium]
MHLFNVFIISVLSSLAVSSCSKEEASSAASEVSILPEDGDEYTYEVGVVEVETVSEVVVDSKVVPLESRPAGKAMRALVESLSEEEKEAIPVIELDSGDGE